MTGLFTIRFITWQHGRIHDETHSPNHHFPLIPNYLLYPTYLFISSFYFIILAAKTATQITNIEFYECGAPLFCKYPNRECINTSTRLGFLFFGRVSYASHYAFFSIYLHISLYSFVFGCVYVCACVDMTVCIYVCRYVYINNHPVHCIHHSTYNQSHKLLRPMRKMVLFRLATYGQIEDNIIIYIKTYELRLRILGLMSHVSIITGMAT